jgi:hypothetical protein
MLTYQWLNDHPSRTVDKEAAPPELTASDGGAFLALPGVTGARHLPPPPPTPVAPAAGFLTQIGKTNPLHYDQTTKEIQSCPA